jgi:type I restriction enzyme, S subunit
MVESGVIHKAKVDNQPTEVGIIPRDWVVVQLGDNVTKVGSGITPTGGEKVYKRNGRPFLRSQNVDWGMLRLSEVAFIDEDTHSTFRGTEIQEGDVLLNITGASIGRSAVADSRVVGGNVNQHVCIIRTDKNVLLPYYLNLFLLSELGQRQIDSFQAGGNRQGLNFAQVRSFKLPLPKTSEQLAITEVLHNTNALIDSLEKLIAKKRAIKQGVMQELLTGKRRLSGFTKHWDTKSIEQLEDCGWLRLSRGQVISKLDIEGTPGDYPIYSSSVHNEGLFGKYGKYMFDEEMITWSVDGGGNFFHRPRHRFSVTNVCGFMRLDATKLDCKFIALQLQLLHGRLTFDYQSKAHPSVIRKAYNLLVPSIDEQRSISAMIIDMEKDISSIEDLKRKNVSLKTGMMQTLLTGKIRLTAQPI